MSEYIIPYDLLADVLLRLPIQSLLRFRCVSKSWCALIDSPEFIKMHFRKTVSVSNSNHEEDLKIVALSDQNTFSTLEFDRKDCSIASARKLSYPLNGEVHLIGSCNGLLCLSNSNTDNIILLWNPWTQKHWVLPSPPIQNSIGSQVISSRLGFGYDQFNDDYKIVNFLKLCDIFEESSIDIQDEVYVYSLKMNLWKRIGEFPWKFPQQKPDVGAFANGALHWIVKKRQWDVSNLIVSFDVKNEEFREMDCPTDPDDDFEQHLKILDEKLCLLSYYYFAGRYRVNLMVMKEYGVEKSWTKLTSIKMPYGIWSLWSLTPIIYLKKGKRLVLQIERDKLVVYDLLTKFIDYVSIRIEEDGGGGGLATSKTFRASCVCLGSLVRPYGEGK